MWGFAGPVGVIGVAEAPRTFWIRGMRRELTMDEILRFARQWGCPIKFFDDEGMLRGTAYPNGEVQT